MKRNIVRLRKHKSGFDSQGYISLFIFQIYLRSGLSWEWIPGVERFVKKHGSTILTYASVAGVIGTGVMISKATVLNRHQQASMASAYAMKKYFSR